MTAVFIGAGTALVGTGFEIYHGLHQEHKANQIEKNLKDPVYHIPPEFYQNREIARQMAMQGLPQEVINQQTNATNQNQAAAIDAISKSSNPGAGVTSVTRQGDLAAEKLAAEDAQARENNQRYFIQENEKLGNQKMQEQQANVFDPYTRKFNEMQAYRGAGMQNVNTGFQDVTQLGGMALNYAANNPSRPQYKNINGTWHTLDPTTGQYTPIIGAIPDAVGEGITTPQLQSSI